MAKVLLKGLKEYFEVPNDEAITAAEMKKDTTKWKEAVKLGNHLCVMVCEIKDIYLDDEIAIEDNTQDKIKVYYDNRREFLNASLEDKVKWSYGQFQIFWNIVNNTPIDKRKDAELIKKWYNKIATKWFTDNPQRTVISLKYLTDEYEKKCNIDNTIIQEEEFNTFNTYKKPNLLKIYELAEITDKQNEKTSY